MQTEPTITVTWSEEVYTPRQYQSFRVGPFSRTIVVKANEDAMEVMDRAYRELEAFALKVRDRKRANYLESLKTLFPK